MSKHLGRMLPRFAALCVAAFLFASCGGNRSLQPPVNQTYSGSATRTLAMPGETVQTPALIAFNANTGGLQYWPIAKGSNPNPQEFAKTLGLSGANGMAANGNQLAVISGSPQAEVVLYNVVTQNKSTLPDPNGTPLDIAIGKDASIYVLNLKNGFGNVTKYPGGSNKPTILPCSLIQLGEAIAVDNEGDVFVNGYESNNATGVVEIPTSGSCKALTLKPETGYVAGIAVDPKTDDLLVLDDPDLCAGGVEGRLVIYPKPYKPSTGHIHVLGGNCTGGLRLNAASTEVFYGDQDVSGSFSFIRQSTYPAGGPQGAYSGGRPGGFTTIPNTLPN